MNDDDFADELIARLNRLCEDPAAKAAVLALLDTKVDVGDTLDGHPTCQVSEGGVMGPLGMLNGLTGVIGHGDRATWGMICAGYRGKGECKRENFLQFYRTDECEFSELQTVEPTNDPPKTYDPPPGPWPEPGT